MTRAESPPPATTGTDRLGALIERRDGRDFPYYAGEPVTIPGIRWIVVIAAVIIAFAALIALPLAGPIASFVPAIIFTGLPLLALAYAAGSHWTAIFRRVSGRDIGLMFLFAGLNIVVTFVVGFIVKLTFGANANPTGNMLASASPLELALFYPRTAIQLVGEELLTILPFLALLYLMVAELGWSRRRAVIIAWIVTAIGFGLVHLPTYGWNVAQAVLIIGTARMVLTLAYIRTKNLWVSAGAHILNDWTLFTLPLLMAGISRA